jgi:hypothetical protein
LWTLFLASPLFAQWDIAAYMGKSITHAADVRVIQPPATDLVFRDVSFEGESFTPPLYYGFRVGYGIRHALAVEGEFIHAKVIGQVNTVSEVRGTLAGVEQRGTLPLATLVERYSISHGLNFVLANGAFRHDIANRFRMVLRAGAGFAVPHLEFRAGNLEVRS